MQPVVTRDATVNGVRVRVAECGTGEPVVCLHGLLFDSRTWSQAAATLAPDFRVIAPDLPGFGESEKPGQVRFSYDIPAYAETVVDLYAGLELGRAALVGHGLGGAVALTLAATHPELVSRLVLIDSMCYPTRGDVSQRLASIPVVGNLLFKQLMGKATFGALISESLLPSRRKLSPEHLEAYYESFNSPAARGSALAALRATLDTSSVIAHTRRIQAPTLVIWGRHDSIYPAAHGQRLAKEIEGAGFQLMDTGHCPQEEAPEELSHVIGHFLMNRRSAA